MRPAAANFDQGGNSIRGRTHLVAAIPFQERFQDVDDLVLVFHDQDAQLLFDKRCGERNLVFVQEGQQILAPDATMAAGVR